MNIAFPPIIGLPLLLGIAALVLAAIAFAVPARLQGNALGRTLLMLRLPAAAIGAVLVGSSFLTPTPHTQLHNPVARTVESVAIGQSLYLNSCASCHGIDLRGGGPAAGGTPVDPPALAGPGSHLEHHTDGDLHYLVAFGMPGGMPAWSGHLTDEQIWHVINYLRDFQHDH